MLYPLFSGWCAGFSKSFTFFTGLNVSIGTSTKMVVHLAMAPFHKPGSSIALYGFPFLFFETINPVFSFTNWSKSNLFPWKSLIAQTISTGLKNLASFAISFWILLLKSICEVSTIWSVCLPFSSCTQKGPPPGSPSFFTIPHTRIGLFKTLIK